MVVHQLVMLACRCEYMNLYIAGVYMHLCLCMMYVSIYRHIHVCNDHICICVQVLKHRESISKIVEPLIIQGHAYSSHNNMHIILKLLTLISNIHTLMYKIRPLCQHECTSLKDYLQQLLTHIKSSFPKQSLTPNYIQLYIIYLSFQINIIQQVCLVNMQVRAYIMCSISCMRIIVIAHARSMSKSNK